MDKEQVVTTRQGHVLTQPLGAHRSLEAENGITAGPPVSPETSPIQGQTVDEARASAMSPGLETMVRMLVTV